MIVKHWFRTRWDWDVACGARGIWLEATTDRRAVKCKRCLRCIAAQRKKAA